VQVLARVYGGVHGWLYYIMQRGLELQCGAFVGVRRGMQGLLLLLRRRRLWWPLMARLGVRRVH
jgi:hypothetical protein